MRACVRRRFVGSLRRASPRSSASGATHGRPAPRRLVCGAGVGVALEARRPRGRALRRTPGVVRAGGHPRRPATLKPTRPASRPEPFSRPRRRRRGSTRNRADHRRCMERRQSHVAARRDTRSTEAKRVTLPPEETAFIRKRVKLCRRGPTFIRKKAIRS